MYGYIVPYKESLAVNDYVLYRAFYCGLCKSVGRQYGQLPRFTTNYDMTFFGVFLHDAASHDVTINAEGCVCNPKKRAIVGGNELLDRIAAVNIITAYYKAVDSVRDRQGGGMAKRMLTKPFKKAEKQLPEAEEIVRSRYEELSLLEKENCAVIDKAAHPFACMLRDLTALLLGDKADDYKKGVGYNIGKLVYLLDALDDIDEDAKKKRYNPLIAAFGGYKSRRQFMEDNRDDLSFILNSTANRAISDFNGIRFTQSLDLMRNIVYRGTREKIKELLASERKLKKPKI